MSDWLEDSMDLGVDPGDNNNNNHGMNKNYETEVENDASAAVVVVGGGAEPLHSLCRGGKARSPPDTHTTKKKNHNNNNNNNYSKATHASFDMSLLPSAAANSTNDLLRTTAEKKTDNNNSRMVFRSNHATTDTNARTLLLRTSTSWDTHTGSNHHNNNSTEPNPLCSAEKRLKSNNAYFLLPLPQQQQPGVSSSIEHHHQSPGATLQMPRVMTASNPYRQQQQREGISPPKHRSSSSVGGGRTASSNSHTNGHPPPPPQSRRGKCTTPISSSSSIRNHQHFLLRRTRLAASPLRAAPNTPVSSSTTTEEGEQALYGPATTTTIKKRKPKRSLGTCTTANTNNTTTTNSLWIDEEETTNTSGSAIFMDHSRSSSCGGGGGDPSMDDTTTSLRDTHNNFRFTSFPASLPRIQGPLEPGGIDAANAKSSSSSSLLRTVHTTNIRKRMSFGSAVAAAGASSSLFMHSSSHHRAHNDSHNTSVSSLQHQDFFSDNEEEEDDDDDENDQDDNDDDDSTLHSSIMSTPRTRLNFHSQGCTTPLASYYYNRDSTQHLAMESNEERGLELVDDFVDDKRFSLSRKHIRISAGSSTLTKRDAGWDDGHGAALSATPLSLLKRRGNSFHTHNNETSDMHLRFPLDAVQCSPIPDIPEEEGYSSSKSDDFPGTSSGLHLSTSSGGSSARPLPDMNAFEEDHANNMSRSSLSSTRSGGDVPPSPKLHCPPTPVRIHPIFRTNLGPKMSRSNSLIANKLLATCSTQGFGARVSLEHPSENAVDVGPVENIDKEKQITACDIDPICHEPEDWLHNSRTFSSTQKVKRCDVKSHVTNFSENVVSMSSSFDVISFLGSGAFADVYKVKSKVGGQLYAVKRNRQQFRSRRDRERVLLEVRSMQRLQSQANLITQRSGETTIDYSLYLLVFYQAWQEDGHFFCQTELCCRDTCREMLDATRSQWNVAKTKYPCLRRLPAPNGVVAGSALDIEGRLLPEPVIWKICHDIASGLSFIHSKHVGLVHNDLKPSNMFFVKHVHFGATCKIGDFGMARSVDSLEDGQEGDQKYMSLEMLETGKSLPKSDIFSLGLALYEMASMLNFVLPSDGYRWHELRNGKHKLEFPRDRSVELSALVCLMIDPDPGKRPTADEILLIRNVADAGKAHCEFLGLYVHEVEVCQQLDEEKDEDQNDEQTPRIAPRTLRSPPFTKQLPNPPLSMHSPTVTLS